MNHGTVIKVYDGDTITIACKMPPSSTLYRFHVRLRHIDCPEIKSSNKEAAIKARDALANLVMGKEVTLVDTSCDKYGRLLANVFTGDGVNLSEWSLENGYSVPYEGGKK